jgi:hypothetical protein
MGICSYCLTWQRDECHSWQQAEACGISGPNDPVRLGRKRDLAEREARDLRSQAKKLRDDTEVKAAALEKRAAQLEQEADEIEARLETPE